MSGNLFTQYLLRLATDAGEVERFRSGGDIARISMDAAGLTPEQQDALLEGDEKAIDVLVANELLPQSPADDAGTRVAFVCLVQHTHGGGG